MKIAHLHLTSSSGGKSTLICTLKDGSIDYDFYSGYMSSGQGQSLSNLQCTLPIEKQSDQETKEQFVKRLIKVINNESIYYKLFHEVDTNVKF